MPTLKAFPLGSPARTSYALRGSIASIEAKLDHESQVALQWSVLWLAGHGALKTPASGIVRTAIRHYAGHLGSLEGREAASEVFRVRDVCHARTVSPEDRHGALERLAAIASVLPLPTLGAVLQGPAYPAMRAALMALGGPHVG